MARTGTRASGVFCAAQQLAAQSACFSSIVTAMKARKGEKEDMEEGRRERKEIQRKRERGEETEAG